MRFLNFEYSIHGGRRLRLQQSDGDIVHGNTGGRLAIEFPVMRVAVDDEIGAMPIDDFRQS